MSALPVAEVRALRGYRRRTTIVLSVLAAVFVGLSVFVVAWAAWDPDARQHLLGRSVHTTAEVVDSSEAGSCRGGTEHDYRLEWSEDGSLRSETITRCGERYSVGERIDIWSTDGDPYTVGPTGWRVLNVALLVSFAGMLWWIVTAGRRLRQAVDAVLAGSPPAGTFPVHRSGPTQAWSTTVVDADGQQRPRRVRSGKVVHTTGEAGAASQGMLSASRVHRGRPRGLALLVTGGLRQWRYLA